ncbi:MAG: gephyrin-like molybdotransferase Glp [Anaerolineaceae bacterium]
MSKPLVRMLSVSEAQNAIVAAFRAVQSEILPLDQSLGRVLAQDVLSKLDLPHFSSSTMDGFAVRSQDILNASSEVPVKLMVTHEIPAGVVISDKLQPGCAARIMTGAPLIPGADAVVPVEDTDQFQEISPVSQVEIRRCYSAGAFIRPVGMEIRKGQRILQKGQKIHPQEIGMLATLGVNQISVFRKPRIAIISSGDELISPPVPLTPGKIYDSNSHTIAAQIKQYGWEVISLGIVRDQPEELEKRLDSSAAREVDLIVSTAGVSVGAYDFVKEVVEKKGSLSFWRVNIRPGKPIAFGSYQKIPFFGLPGNPVSAFVGFRIFVLPALRKLSGLSKWKPEYFKARLSQPLESDGRESYLRCIVHWQEGEFHAQLIENQSSGYLNSLVEANALLIVPSGVKSLPKETLVDFWFLNNDDLLTGG